MPCNPDLQETNTVLTVSMAQKLKLNQRGEYKTWLFTSTLTPTHQINAVIPWIATKNIAVVDPNIMLVKAAVSGKNYEPGMFLFVEMSCKISKLNHSGYRMQGMKSCCLICFSKDTYSQMMKHSVPTI